MITEIAADVNCKVFCYGSRYICSKYDADVKASVSCNRFSYHDAICRRENERAKAGKAAATAAADERAASHQLYSELRHCTARLAAINVINSYVAVTPRVRVSTPWLKSFTLSIEPATAVMCVLEQRYIRLREAADEIDRLGRWWLLLMRAGLRGQLQFAADN